MAKGKGERDVFRELQEIAEKPEPRNPIIAVNVDKLYLHQINAGQNSSSEVLLHKVPDIDADPSLKVRIEQ